MVAIKRLLVVFSLSAACGYNPSSRTETSSGQTPIPNNPKTSMIHAPELTLIVDAKYSLPMGYGAFWSVTVREVAQGTLPDRQFQLSLAEDPDHRHYGSRFNFRDEVGVKLRFYREPDRPAALTGFVAADGTTWSLIDVDAK